MQVVVVMEWRKERRRERVAEFRSEILKRALATSAWDESARADMDLLERPMFCLSPWFAQVITSLFGSTRANLSPLERT